MKNLKKIIFASSLMALIPLLGFAANPNDKWSTVVVEKWANDESDQAVMLIDLMACVMKEGGVSLIGFGEKTWTALIDEKVCDINPSEETSTQDQKAIVTFVSQKAVTTQTLVGHMEMSNGQKVVMNATLDKSIDEQGPYGIWSSSFYFVPENGEGKTLNELLAADEQVFYGFGQIKMSGSDVVVMSAQTKLSNDMPLTKSKITYANGVKTDVTYVFRGETNLGSGMQLGKASATRFFSRSSDGDGNFTADTDAAQPPMCKARDKKWISTWKAALYDENGDRLKPTNGPFQFKVKGKTTNERGQINNRHVWFDDELEGMKLSPVNPTLKVTRNDTGAEVTLNLAPYFMESSKLVSFTPKDGDKFEGGGSDHGTRGTWDLTAMTITRGGVSHTVDEIEWFHSDFYDAEYVYTPKNKNGGAVGTWQEIVRLKIPAEDYPETTATYKCFGDWGCPHTDEDGDGLSWELPQYMGLGKDDNQFDYNAFEKKTHGNKGPADKLGDREHTYFMTPLKNVVGSYKAGTLYYDHDASGALSVGDKPLEFRFNVSDMYGADGQREKKVMEWGSTTAAKWEIAVGDDTYVKTPNMHVRLIPAAKVADKTCGVNGGADVYENDFWNCPHSIDWQAHSWAHDHTIYATKADGSIIPIDPERKLKYTTDLKEDLNCNPDAGGNCSPIKFPALFQENQWIEWLRKPCDKNLPDDGWDADEQQCWVELNIASFDGVSITVEYDGEVRGVPGYFDRRINTTLRVANPSDGTVFTEVVTDGSTPKTYTYKALGIDEMYLPLIIQGEGDDAGDIDLAQCDAIRFDTVPANHNTSDLPVLTDKVWVSPDAVATPYSMPSQTWNDKPDIAPTNTCEVASGIASDGCSG